MAQIIMDHGVSGCFGTRLAPVLLKLLRERNCDLLGTLDGLPEAQFSILFHARYGGQDAFFYHVSTRRHFL